MPRINVLPANNFKTLIAMTLSFFLLSCTDKQADLPQRELDKPLVFIGLDGAEWSVIDPMLERGELPNIKKLMDTGIHTGLINPGALVSPPTWTTFVTGEYPRFHGILDHTFPFDNSKSKKPVDSTLRMSPAIWNIASGAGLRSAALGYFVSWPAEDIVGTIVTDRAMQKFPHSVFPESLVDEVYSIVSEVTDDDAQEEFLRRYYSWGYRPEQADDPNHSHHKAAKLIIRRGDRLMVNDEITLRTAMALQTDAYDLVVTYFRSTDLASHSFWREYDDSGFATPADPELKEQLGDVIPETYRYVDEAIGKLMDKFGDQANYIIVSDHGFHSASKELVLKNRRRSVLTVNHRSVGILIASGPDIRSQSSLPNKYYATVLDIMPTLVRLLGLPVATGQSGSPLKWLFTGNFKRDNPLQTIPTYPVDDFARAYNSAASVDQKKEMSSLSGLGYIGGEVTGGATDMLAYNFWQSEKVRLATHISGEIIQELMSERFQAAAAIMAEVVTHKPELEKRILHQVRSRLMLISESTYISKPINAKRLVRKFKEQLPAATTAEM